MLKPDWRWIGDKDLRLHGSDGALQAICRKLPIREGWNRTIVGWAWWLYDAADQPVLVGRDHDQHVYRLAKREIQAAAIDFAAGREVTP